MLKNAASHHSLSIFPSLYHFCCCSLLTLLGSSLRIHRDAVSASVQEFVAHTDSAGYTHHQDDLLCLFDKFVINLLLHFILFLGATCKVIFNQSLTILPIYANGKDRRHQWKL